MSQPASSSRPSPPPNHPKRGKWSKEAFRLALSQVWDAAFEEGRLNALDELQDRFCVCMK